MLRNGPGGAQKGSEMVRKKTPKRLRNGLKNGPGLAQKGPEMVREDPRNGLGGPRLRNGPGSAQKGSEIVREEVISKVQKWSGPSPKKPRNGPGGPKKRSGWSGAQKWSGLRPRRLREAQKGSEMVREELRKAQKWSQVRLRNGPGGAQKGSEMVRLSLKKGEPKKAQKWSGKSTKRLRVREELKKPRNGPGGAQKRLKNSPGASEMVWEEPRKAQSWGLPGLSGEDAPVRGH